MSIFLDDKKIISESTTEKETTQMPAAEQAPAAGDPTSVTTAPATTPTDTKNTSAEETFTENAPETAAETIDIQAQEEEKQVNEQLENLWSHGREQLTDIQRPKQVQPDPNIAQPNTPITKTTNQQPVTPQSAPREITEQQNSPATPKTPEAQTAPATIENGKQSTSNNQPLQQETPKNTTSKTTKPTEMTEHSDLPAIQEDHPLVTQENDEHAELIKKE